MILVIAYLVVVLILPLALSAAVSLRALPRGRRCPRCGQDTVRLRAPLLGVLARLAHGDFQRRWCLACRWEGATRIAPARIPPGSVRTVTLQNASSTAVTRVMDVRSLFVDGTPWRVRLECWGNRGTCWGRLVFVEPTGRLWLDIQPLRGRSDRDVLGQALSLPDDLLTSRLRTLVSD
jgi:hypothetical protein